MRVTVITMYRSSDAELFTQGVEGELTDEQKEEWRKAHRCDEHDLEPDDDCPNNLFFRVLDVLPGDWKTASAPPCLLNVDGDA